MKDRSPFYIIVAHLRGIAWIIAEMREEWGIYAKIIKGGIGKCQK